MGFKRKKIVGGVTLYSVTTVLGIIRMPFLETWRGKLGNAECNKVLQDAIKFGKDFHNYCELIDQGRGDEINVEDIPGEMGQLVAKFKSWHFENVQEVIAVEKEVNNISGGYFGITDAVYKLKGVKNPAVIDRKTNNSIDRKMSYQLSAYKETDELKDMGVEDRIILWCKKDGSFEQITLDRDDHFSCFSAFMSAKNLYIDYNTGGKK